ncbi:MAG: hypothetical protein GY953_21610, partial [bacterium]|nr:hypothetical protein [bacterium]
MTERKNGKSKSAGSAPQVDWGFVERCLGAKEIRTVYFHGPPGLGKTYA